jgi:hypothetical protein
MIGTGLAQITFCRIPNNAFRCLNHGFMRANPDTFSAANAALPTVDSLRCDVYAFRVVAPAACQRTTLEEHSASNARPIVNRIFFYIKNGA